MIKIWAQTTEGLMKYEQKKLIFHLFPPFKVVQGDYFPSHVYYRDMNLVSFPFIIIWGSDSPLGWD